MATQAEVARDLGLSERWLRELTGSKVVTDPGRGKWDALTVARELLEYRRREMERLKAEIASLKQQQLRSDGETAGKAVEDARHAKAKADKAEMEVAHMRGELILVQDVVEPLQNAVLMMKTLMLALPAKVAPKVGAKHPVRAEEVIREHVVEALEKLSKVKVATEQAS